MEQAQNVTAPKDVSRDSQTTTPLGRRYFASFPLGVFFPIYGLKHNFSALKCAISYAGAKNEHKTTTIN